MSDLNDLNKPTPTDTEPNVLDTLRAHIIRAATWSGWSATGNKVAGIMSAVTTAVSGGRSLRLYRRNDANTSDEEIVILPGVSIGGSANAVAWSGVSGKPSTVAGYGITDMGSQTVSHASTAGSANAAPWSGVSGKPSTVVGYGITDMGSQSVNYANSAGSAANASTVTNVTTAQVLAATAGASAGGVGTYVFARPSSYNSTTEIVFGQQLAGSQLAPIGAVWNDAKSSGAPVGAGGGSALSGTWRCMGNFWPRSNDFDGGYLNFATLWLRIA